MSTASTATSAITVTIREDHALALRLLRDAGDRPLTLDALRRAGVRRPATVLYELELAGHDIARVAGGGAPDHGFRLHEQRAPAVPGAGRRPRWSGIARRRR